MSDSLEGKLDRFPKMPQYTYEGYIGNGAWHEVVLATRNSDHSKWVLKFLRPTDKAKQQRAERGWSDDAYWRRASMGGEVPTDKHIAQNFIDETPEGERVLAERYIDRFLDTYLANHQPSLSETFHIIKELASALDVYHNKAAGIGTPHGDLHPKNLGYTTDNTIVISDNGTATITGNGIGDRGTEATKAPENWTVTGSPTKTSDVWSVGAIMYRLFTGEDLGVNEETAASFRNDAQLWRDTIDEKINDKRIPRAYRTLLKQTLYNPDDRINDGSELADAVRVSESSYKNGRPGRVAALSAAAILGLATVGALIGGYIHFTSQNEQLAGELSQLELREDYEDKASDIKNFVMNRYDVNDMFETSGYYKFRAWVNMMQEEGYTDDKFIHASYLNPDLMYRAEQIHGSRDYDILLPYLRDVDLELVMAVGGIDSQYMDNWMRSYLTEFPDQVREQWEEVKQEYQTERQEAQQEYDAELNESRQRVGMASDAGFWTSKYEIIDGRVVGFNE